MSSIFRPLGLFRATALSIFTIRVKDGGFTVFATFFVLATHFDFAIRVPHGERTVIGSVFFYPLPSESSIGIESGPFSIRLIVLEASFVNEFPVLGKANGFLMTSLVGGFGELKSIRGALQSGDALFQEESLDSMISKASSSKLCGEQEEKKKHFAITAKNPSKVRAFGPRCITY